LRMLKHVLAEVSISEGVMLDQLTSVLAMTVQTQIHIIDDKA
jgi:hypothetical protein